MKKISSLLQSIHQTRLSMEILSAYSNTNFYESFSQCGCTSGMYSLIKSYKKSWKAFQKNHETISKKYKASSDKELAFLKSSFKKLTAVVSNLDFSSIQVRVSASNPYPQREYISETIIPLNKRNVVEIISILNEVYKKLIEKIK